MLRADTFRDQSNPSQASAEPLGHVHSVTGSQASIGLLTASLGSLARAGITVGKFVKIMPNDYKLALKKLADEAQALREDGKLEVAHG